MELQAMTCENCHADVSTLGDAHVWLDRPVCKTCFERLSKANSISTRGFWMPLAIAALVVSLVLAGMLFKKTPITPDKAPAAATLQEQLADTKWEWDGDSLVLQPNGIIKHDEWISRGLETRWMVADAKTVVFLITKGREDKLCAVLHFNDTLDSFDAINFENLKLNGQKRLSPKK